MKLSVGIKRNRSQDLARRRSITDRQDVREPTEGGPSDGANVGEQRRNAD